MAPNLQGLNIVHPVQAYDPQDLSYPELSAQLDLWTHLPFENDDSPSSRAIDKKNEEQEEKEENRAHKEVNYQQQPFDINSILSGFVDQQQQPHPLLSAIQQQQQTQLSLAQLLTLAQTPGSASFLTPPQFVSPPSTSGASDEPPAKRARARKDSIVTSPESPSDNSTPLTASEDKRRRNTAASARFRLKKKEREAALEGRAKELEGRVGELERECEGLRRENGWLKGLVVGVTGAAAQVPQQGVKRAREDDS